MTKKMILELAKIMALPEYDRGTQTGDEIAHDGEYLCSIALYEDERYPRQEALVEFIKKYSVLDEIQNCEDLKQSIKKLSEE